MFSLQHPETDERFLDLESTVEEVIQLLSGLMKPTESEVNCKTEARPTAESVTEDNFMVTKRENRPPYPARMRICTLKKLQGKAKENPDRFTFMRQVEVDQDERSKARLERERIAQNFRKLGNAEYRKANYNQAIHMFNEAIENINDSPILYINRALCYIKLEKFKRAIVDCDFVLNKLDEKNLRAWLYRAMAYKHLNDEASFENCVKYAKKFNSKQLEFIDSFVEKINN
ncbi:uncharacterized protein Dwil_GK10830 [Drosophila willistoni]|uniref:Uncharacterized protein n=1 Tax=Drosophila willistoni TaxID=7260 RepID=B4NAA1_DROWI|nr:tetratricopeptide repeat protein 12 [Drosophila willistoni]EDW81788.1 uncharacterized protein Dwil_GK10830 [Drosophila willistoni]